MNAAFIGAGFLAGTLATGLVLATATRWRTFSTLPPALLVLASTLLAATIIHRDRFRWGYPPTWVWALVYGGARLRRSSRTRRSPRGACCYWRCRSCIPDDVNGGELWIALMLVLLGLSGYALSVALSDRERL